jgi:hypothetical protein
MSQFSFDSPVVEESRPETQNQDLQLESHEEAHSEPDTLAFSADDFTALEERVLRTVNLVKRERLARAEAEERASQAEAKLQEKAPLAEQLQNEVSALRAEREQVRERVERLLAQLDALEL